MLEITRVLNIQPGDIPPVIHLKQGSDAVDVVLRIKAAEATLETGGQAVLKGTKPDESALFVVLPVSGTDGSYIDVDILSDTVKLMTDVAGKYDCTLSIIDSEDSISKDNYESYDCVTVQPFTCVVEKSAVE